MCQGRGGHTGRSVTPGLASRLQQGSRPLLGLTRTQPLRKVWGTQAEGPRPCGTKCQPPPSPGPWKERGLWVSRCLGDAQGGAIWIICAEGETSERELGREGTHVRGGGYTLFLRGDQEASSFTGYELQPSDTVNEKRLRGNTSCFIGFEEDGKGSFLSPFLPYSLENQAQRQRGKGPARYFPDVMQA